MTKPSEAEQKLLAALAEGAILKSHRSLDGSKVFRLHSLQGNAELVDGEIVHSLEKKHLIDSNKKFPAAAYLLTEKGREIAAKLVNKEVSSLGAKDFVR